MSSSGRRKAKPRTDKGSKLYVQPAELARKLVKEMEGHKVSRGTQVSVRNRYTIFLCPEDFDRLRDNEEILMAKFERHLAKHVAGKGYRVAGDIGVGMTVDPDLRPGYFGILAERQAPGLVEQDLASRLWSERSAEVEDPLLPRNGRVAPIGTDGPGVSRGGREASSSRAEPPVSAGLSRYQRVEPEQASGATRSIPAEDAEALGLARQTIVINAGNRVREFHQGRVILGRSRDVDFVIDNADVSRRHAVLYWSSGDIVLEDLGSTNGTMVNGYPISSTIVGPDDVVTIGDCRLTVGTK